MIDWVSGCLELFGSWVTGNKKKWGFLISMMGNIGWVVYVIVTHSTYGLLVVVLPAIFINIRNFVKWHKEERNVSRYE
jgi:hypothetical protein